MTQIFTEEGVMIPVTVIEARPNKVIQIKTKETDGYSAVQIGYMDLKENRANKPTKGHFQRWGAPLKKYLAEVRLEEGEEYAPGQEIKVTSFEEGKKIDVTGTSKGKGTQGNIKRHGHHRGPMSHGSKHKRLPGALAAGTYPSRVFKGNDGPGRMGNETVTIQNLELVKIIPERNLLLVKGAVPGSRGGVVCVRYAVKACYPDDVRLAVKEEPPAPEVVEEVIEEAVAEEPAAEEPVAEEPVAEEPAAEEPAAPKDPETVGEVIAAVEEVVKEAEETIGKAANKAEEAPEAPKEPETVGEVIATVEEVVKEAEETIGKAATEAEEAVAEAADTIEGVAPDVVEAAEAVEEVVTEAVGAVAEAAPEAVDAATEAAEAAAVVEPADVEEAVADVAGVVTEVVLEATEKMAEKAVAEEAAADDEPPAEENDEKKEGAE